MIHDRLLRLLPPLVFLVALARPVLAVAPADTTDAGLLAAARMQITAGQATKAVVQLTPVIDGIERSGKFAQHEPLLTVYVEALGKGTQLREPDQPRRAQLAVDLATQLHGARSTGAATALLNLARCRLQMKDARTGRALADSAVALRRALLGPDDPELAAALVVAGRAARENDDPDGAERRSDEVYAIRARTLPPDHVDLAAALNNRALARRMRGDFQGAFDDGNAALAIYEKKLPPTHQNRILCEKNTATSAMFLGEPLAGIDGYQKAIAGYLAETPPDTLGIAIVTDELGLAYKDLGDYDQALASHRKARALAEAYSQPDSVMLRNLAINHGETLRAKGDLEAARAEFERGLVLDKALGLASKEGEIAIEHDLGLVAQQQGRSAEAVAHLTRAIELKLPRTGEDGIGSVLIARAMAEHDAGLADSARADLVRTRAIAERTVGAQAMFTAQVDMLIAQMDAERGDSAQAFDRALAAETMARARLKETVRYLSERQARAYALARPRALNLVLSLAAARSGDRETRRRAWDCLMRSRGLVLDELAARQAGLRGEARDSAIAELEQRLYHARQRMANLVIGQKDAEPNQAARNAFAFASQEAEGAERALARRTGVTEREGGLGEVLAKLPKDGALVAFVRWNRASMFAEDARPGYAAFVGRGGEVPLLVDLGPAERIDDLVRAWRGALAKDDVRKERAEGGRLAHAVWEPIEGAFLGATRLWIVPDGSLNDVAWYALPSGQGRVLDQDLEIRLISNGRDLLDTPSEAPAHGPVLVLGGADYDLKPRAPPGLVAMRGGGDPCASFASRHFGPLPFSAREAQGVASLARTRPGGGGVIELEGRQALEPLFTQDAPGATWIHAATHGFFVDQACRDAGWEKDEDIAASAATDPMLYSGIALAGANRRAQAASAGEDGLLTADECARMDLSNVRGMVITGCDTGLGDYVTGEGVYGLRRALERAGVRSLTLALWPVDDQASARWALAFYDGLWRRGLSPAAANRLAMRRVRQELRAARMGDHPRLWAGFVDSGAGN